MQLEDVSAVVRPRGYWEAIDLGIRLVRPDYARMLWISLLATAPLFVATQLVMWNHLVWAPLVLWWLKPLWERTHLHSLSRRLFGEAPTVGETLRAFRSYGFRQWLPWLTIRRLSPTRSLDLAITQLEGLSGAQRRRRIDLLHRGSTSTGAVWLTVVCANLEGFIYLAFALAFEFMAADPFSELDLLSWLGSDAAETRSSALLLNAVLHGVALLVAPFYVGGGFGLYINRRTILEGWDLEIAFGRIAGRIRALDRRRGAVFASAVWLAWLAMLAAPLLLGSREVQASAADDALTPDAARHAIEQVLDAEVFHERRTTRVPRFLLDWEFEEEEVEEPWEWLASLERVLLAVFQGIAALGEVILIAGVLALVGYAVYRSRDEPRALRRPASPARTSLPSVLLGFDVTRDSLPDDVAGAVLEIWRRGASREALALLYRATLSELAHCHGVAFGVGSTERDCLAAVSRSASPEHAAFFRELTRSWQWLAYAHRSVSTPAVESLCSAWIALFDRSTQQQADEVRRG